ncbi:hypothetical protein HDU93_004361, partial [Gonapodya sp. JEL0774]
MTSGVHAMRMGGRLSIEKLLKDPYPPREGHLAGGASDLEVERDFRIGVTRTRSGNFK